MIILSLDCCEREEGADRMKDLKVTIYDDAKDILKSGNFRGTRLCMQHGTKSVHEHCVSVAACSLWLNRRFHMNCYEKDLVRGALLHDYFLYDWHDKGHGHLHGFFHPAIALKNAEQEYKLSSREQDIIKKHMWPMTVVPPMCREAWVVTAADKYCSLLETLHVHRGQKGAKINRQVKRLKTVG